MLKKVDEPRTEKLNMRVNPTELSLFSDAARKEDLARSVRRRKSAVVSTTLRWPFTRHNSHKTTTLSIRSSPDQR